MSGNVIKNEDSVSLDEYEESFEKPSDSIPKEEEKLIYDRYLED